MSSITSSITPGYEKFDPYQNVPHSEAVQLRIRTDFKNKLKALTKSNSPDQEFCDACPVLPGILLNPAASTTDPSLLRSVEASKAASAYNTLAFKKTIKFQVRSKTSEDDFDEDVHLISDSSEQLEANFNAAIKADANTQASRPNLQRIPHNEVDNLMTVFTNNHVAHEIAINRCYRLNQCDDHIWSPTLSEANDPALKLVSQQFWDIFATEIKLNKAALRKTEASYNVTFEVMGQLRLQLLSILMPHNIGLKEELQKVLGSDLVTMKNSILENALDFEFDYDCYKWYAVDILGKICCPSRDEEVEELRKLDTNSDPVQAYRRVFGLIYKMKGDMNNFFLQLFRPLIMKSSIETERRKFADFMELEYRLHEDGCKATRNWLLKHRLGVRDTFTVIAKAFGKVLNWHSTDPWPETLLEDIQRFERMSKVLDRIGIVGGVVLEIGRMCHKIFKSPPPLLRQSISKYIKLLIPQSEKDLSPENLLRTLEPVAQKSVEAVQKIISKYLKRSIRSDERTHLYEAVMSVSEPENKYRKLMIQRTIDYAEEVIIAAREYHVTLPSTLTAVMIEVASLVSEFHRVVLHNRACYEELYVDIIESRNNAPIYPEENDYNWDLGLLHSLHKLRTPIATPEEARELEALEHERHKKIRQAQEEDGIKTCPSISASGVLSKIQSSVDSLNLKFNSGTNQEEKSRKKSNALPKNFHVNLVHTMKTVEALHAQDHPPDLNNPRTSKHLFSGDHAILQKELDAGNTGLLDAEEKKQVLAWAKDNLVNETIIFKNFCEACKINNDCAGKTAEN